MSDHRCMWGPAKRGSWLVCSICEDRFPCAGNDCGHMDCIIERKTMPKCHFCHKVVHGSGMCKPLYDLPEGLQELAGEEGDWVLVNGRGNNTYAAHACCRDAYANTPKSDMVSRFKGGYEIQPCPHEFEGKEPISLSLLKSLAGT